MQIIFLINFILLLGPILSKDSSSKRRHCCTRRSKWYDNFENENNNKKDIIFDIKKEIKSDLPKSNIFNVSFQFKNNFQLEIKAENINNTKIYSDNFSVDFFQDIDFEYPQIKKLQLSIISILKEIISQNNVLINEKYNFIEMKFINKAIQKDKDNIPYKEKIIFIPELKIFNNDNNFIEVISELKNEINSLKNEIIELKLKNVINFTPKSSSVIIGNNYRFSYLLKNWINSHNRLLQANLLFRMSQDGSDSLSFHKLCDNKEPTLTLFKLKNGFKVGIYLSQSYNIKINENPVDDDKAFIFNLNKEMKYKPIKRSYSHIWFYNEENKGPNINDFGCRNNLKFFFVNFNNKFENGNDFLPINDDLNCRYNDNNEIYFEVEEIEVFQIFED